MHKKLSLLVAILFSFGSPVWSQSKSPNVSNKAKAEVEEEEGDAGSAEEHELTEEEESHHIMDLIEQECAKKKDVRNLFVRHQEFLSLIDSGGIWIPLPLAGKCFPKDQKVELFSGPFKGSYGISKRGVVKVVESREETFETIKKLPSLRVTSDKEKWIKRRLKRGHPMDEAALNKAKFTLIKIVPVEWQKSKNSYGPPANHPFASTIDLKEFKELLAKNIPAYDVRPKYMFDQSSIPGTKNLPVPKKFAKIRRPLNPKEIRKGKFQLPWSEIAQNKEKQIILFSNCSIDELAFNSISFLYSKGFRKMLWYRAGTEGFKGNFCITPEKVDGINIASATEVKDALNQKKKIVYAYSGVSFSKYRISSSIDIYYKQKNSKFGIPEFRNASFSLDELEKAGDSVEIQMEEFPVEEPVIVYGFNDFDWRALKLAKYLKLKGVKNVSWYRLGLEDWLNRGLFDPKIYETVPPLDRKSFR